MDPSKQNNWQKVPRQLAVPVELGEMYADGETVKKADRKELLKRLRAGEVFTLTVNVQSYLQPEAPIPLPKSERKKANYNFARFVPEELAKFARSFKGQLFLRDHNRRSMADVGGRILESEAVHLDGRVVFQQKLELVKPWAIEDALDGTMSTFSIGWDPKEPGWEGFKQSLLCSLCMAPMFGRDGCLHMPGEVVEPTEANNLEAPVIVEALWTKVLGAETSEVAFPAVQGTGVKEIQAALSACIEIESPEQSMTISKALMAALSLTATATEDEAIAAANALRSECDEANKQLAAKDEEIAKERQLRVEAAAKADKAESDAREAQVTALREEALDKGRWIDGDKSDEMFKKLAEQSVDLAKEFHATREPGASSPAGSEMQSGGESAKPTRKSTKKLSKSEREFCKARGMTEEQYLEYAYAEDETTEDEE